MDDESKELDFTEKKFSIKREVEMKEEMESCEGNLPVVAFNSGNFNLERQVKNEIMDVSVKDEPFDFNDYEKEINNCDMKNIRSSSVKQEMQDDCCEDTEEGITQETSSAVAEFCSMSLTKKWKKPETKTQNELLSLACGYLSRQQGESDTDVIVKGWVIKLKRLPRNQKLYAEKAINNILFEAEMGTLHRNSVKINEMSTVSSSAVSTPAPYST